MTGKKNLEDIFCKYHDMICTVETYHLHQNCAKYCTLNETTGGEISISAVRTYIEKCYLCLRDCNFINAKQFTEIIFLDICLFCFILVFLTEVDCSVGEKHQTRNKTGSGRIWIPIHTNLL